MNEDDELLDQEEKGRGSGGGNPISNLENGARNVQNAAQKGADIANKSAEQYQKKVLNQTGKKAITSKMKAESRKKMAANLSKVAARAGKVANVASKLAPIIATVALVIIILIVVIGLLVFILTGLGFIMSGLQQIVNGFFKFFEANFNGKESIVDAQSIIDTASYLEEMGYDLYGYGFTAKDNALEAKKEPDKDENGNEKKDKDGNVIYKETGNKELAYKSSDEAYKYITTYLISDNYANCIKNSNKNFRAAFSSVGGFFDGLFGNSTAWGSGLISIFHDKGEIGVEGEAYGLSGVDHLALMTAWTNPASFLTTLNNWDDLTSSIKINDGKLVINGPGLFNDTIMEYSLDGWIGRYGMPLEFLLATHVSTMAPDLSYKLATSFNTDIEILLHKSEEGQIDAAIQEKGNESTRVWKTELAKINNSMWTGRWGMLETASLTHEEVYKIFQETSLASYSGDDANYEGFKCTGPPTSENVIGSISLTGSVAAGDDVDGCIKAISENSVIENGFYDRFETLKNDGYSAIADIALQDEIKKSLIITNSNYAEHIKKEDENELKCSFSKDVNIKNDAGEDKILRFEMNYYINKHGTAQKTPTYEVFLGADAIVPQESGILCSSSENKTGTVCDHCKNYIVFIYEQLNKVQEDDFDTYVPYINKVTDHWFRNVYFTEAAIGGDTIIQTDDEYEKKTGERWTLYETYKDDNGNEQYELYVYLPNDDGSYGTGDKLDFSKQGDKYIVCRKVGSGNGNYDLADDGTTYKKAKGGMYKLQLKDSSGKYSDYTETVKEFRVGKKAISQTIDDGWMAYELGDSNEEVKTMTIDENSPQSFNKLNDLGLELVYKASYPTVKQVEDGVRGETNATIKKLFLDDYYIYDGTKSTAALIEEAKKTVKEKDSSLDSDDPDSFATLVEQEKIKNKITKDYEDKEYTATIDQISGPISLTHSSLNAFSILKNMHTLDAEYIYHDFKELIVELNYFDKEDLVEAEDEVMMFPISGLSAAGWPVTRYDKSEDYYGTLIHSATDLEARKAENEADLAEQFGLDAEVDTIDEDTNTPNTEAKSSSDGLFSSEQCNDGSCNRIVKANGIEYKQFAQGDYTRETNDGHSIKEGGCGICSTAALLTGYGYDVDPNAIVTKKTKLGLKWYPDNGQRADNIQKIFKSYGIEGEWKKPSGLEEIKKVLHDALDNGIPVIIRIAPGGSIWQTNGGHYFGVVGQDSDGKLYTVDSATKSNINRLVNDGGIDALANDINGHLLMIFVPNEAPDGTQKTSSDMTEPEFAGYAGSEEDAPEYVIAPVTGEVIKYGTIKRTNIETGEKDQEVGFIKIRVLGATECASGKECNFFGGSRNTKITKKDIEDNNATTWLEDKYSEDVWKKLGYDYFWEEYNDAGIAGNVLYIEGFDVSDILGKKVDQNQNATGNIKKLAEYIADENTANSYSTAYTVPNLLDDKREFELKIAEAAKEKAAYTITKKVDGKEKIYIKEGAVIGKTYSSKDAKITKDIKLEVIDKKAEKEKEQEQEGQISDINDDSNSEENEVATKKKKYKIGNYMRVILRDTKDEVVENVEDYVETGESENHEDVDWDFYYWVPYESGGLGEAGIASEVGAGACGTISGPSEVAVGIAQWTSFEGRCNNIPELCKWLVEQDSSLCSELSVFESYSAAQVAAQYFDLKNAWNNVNKKNPDKFLELQMQYFYEVEFTAWVKNDNVEWLLDKSLVAQGTYASLKNWGPGLGWKNVISESMSDQEIVKALLKKACTHNSSVGSLNSRWESQYVLANDILSNTFTEVENWVRTKQPSDKYGEGKNTGSLSVLTKYFYKMLKLAYIDNKYN